ncbi:uncharacterized protein LOC142471429 [Ascaphus truei]|uniref:uncharacterized protein LOC142471429 n=1 Tax=Ascaphus truei TaxID=8439 RepID=UPI003F5A71BE
MSLWHSISSFFSPRRPTSSHLHLLKESQPLRDLQPPNPVELRGARSIEEGALEMMFQERVSHLGGRESVLLVGEAGYSPASDGGSSGILQELSFALFRAPEKNGCANEGGEGAAEGDNSEVSCLTTRAPSESRIFPFPVILTVFRDALIMDSPNVTLIREVLKDIKTRTKGRKVALVGVAYSREEPEEETKMESQLRFGQLMGQVFGGRAWGVCSYVRTRPETIQEVKRTIRETVEGEARGQDPKKPQEDPTDDLDVSFKDLVSRLGGERAIPPGGDHLPLCPSHRTSRDLQRADRRPLRRRLGSH